MPWNNARNTSVPQILVAGAGDVEICGTLVFRALFEGTVEDLFEGWLVVGFHAED